MFYLVCNNLSERTELIKTLKDNEVLAVFHYLSLHKSEFFEQYSKDRFSLPNSDKFQDCLVRLPLYYELTKEEVNKIVDIILRYYENI